jgi:hypothetical protein
MPQIRLGTVAPILILLLCVLSCDRFTGGPSSAKPTQVVDLPSMVGKSLQEMTTMLGPPTPQVLCYDWELAEGELNVCYETSDYAKRFMSSISYNLKPYTGGASDRGVGSPEEMMALVHLDVQGKGPEENRRGFVTYKDLSINGKSCFVDVHPRGTNLIFAPRGPRYMTVELYVQNPNITLFRETYHKGYGKDFYEQQTDIDLPVGSVLMGHGNWEVCTGANFTGNCKILDGVDREYLDNSNNFSAFGIGGTIRSLRPVEGKVR